MIAIYVNRHLKTFLSHITKELVIFLVTFVIKSHKLNLVIRDSPGMEVFRGSIVVCGFLGARAYCRESETHFLLIWPCPLPNLSASSPDLGRERTRSTS